MRKDVPGAVVLVGKGDRVLHRRAYGHRSVEPEKTPLHVDDLFDLASLTKPLATGLAVMVLVEEGRLSPADKASAHLPALRHGDHAKITVEQLLLHTSGLPAGHEPDARDLADPVREIAKLPLGAKPGERFVYSDLGYVLLQKLVETIAERPLPNVAGRVWLPLGLRDTTFVPHPPDPDRCVPTEKRNGVMLLCEVHDRRAAQMGGVAGHAGLFSTADDIGKLARLLLRRGELGVRILGTETVKEMTKPRKAGERGLRAYGWDVDTGYSHNRGDRFGKGGFGHTGFTGTSLWIDPPTESFVVVLASRVHPDGKGDAKRLRREVANAVAEVVSRPKARVGVEVLLAERRELVEGKRVGLLTHRAAVDASGTTTKSLFAKAPGIRLTRLFSPEHGQGADDGAVADTLDPDTGVRVVSLYGKKVAPTAKDLEGLDVLVVDLQDAGARFYTYESTLGHVLGACESAGVPVVVLDRPSPAGEGVEGPVLAAERRSFVGFHTVPIRHGMTLGELARMYQAERFPKVSLEVVAMKDWTHADGLVGAGRRWVKPSPSLATPLGARLYPGVALLEFTNVSVGRGTDEPFTVVGAPSFDGAKLKAALDELALPGLDVEKAVFTPTNGPFTGQPCGGVRFTITDEAAFRPVRLGLALVRVLHAAYPKTWSPKGVGTLLGGEDRVAELLSAQSLEDVEAAWSADQSAFVARRGPFLLYP